MVKYLKQLAGDSAVYGLSSLLTRFLNFFLVPIFTRVFDPDRYGVISLINSAAVIVAIFAGLALDNSAHRWFWDTESEDDRKRTVSSWIWCQWAFSAACALLLGLFSRPLAVMLTDSPRSQTAVLLALANLPLMTAGIVLENWFRMQRQAWRAAGLALFTTACTLGFTVLFVVVMKKGVIGVFLAPVITSLLRTGIALVLMRDWIRPSFFRFSRLREMLRFALPLIPASLAFWVGNYADRYFVKLYCSLEEVGLYTAGASVAAFTVLFTGAFQQAWGPFAFSIHAREEARRVYAQVFLSYLIVACGLATLISLFAPELVRAFATARYQGGSSVVPFLAFSFVMIGLTYIATIGLSIMKLTTPNALGITMSAVVTIGGNWLLTPRFGKEGAALAMLLGQSIPPLYLFYRGHKVYPIPFRFGAGAAILAWSALLVVAARLFLPPTGWESALGRLGLLALFVPVVFALGIVSPARIKKALARL